MTDVSLGEEIGLSDYRKFDFLTQIRESYPHQDPCEERRDYRVSRTTPATRTCVYVRACTRDDRYDNLRRRTHTTTARRDRFLQTNIRTDAGRLADGPSFRWRTLSCSFSVVQAFDRGSSCDAFEKEKRAPPVARERVTEIVYMSFDLYHRAISPSAHPLSLCLSSVSFFFSPLPPYLSGLPLRTVSPFRQLVSRARETISFNAQLASSFGYARGPYSRCLDFDISAIYCGAT